MNNLTGDHEAVLQLSVRQLNGILATLHQRAMYPDASPTFPHSGTIRVGDPPLLQGVEALRYGRWVMDTAKAMTMPAGASKTEVRTLLGGHAPPGLMPMFERAWTELDLSVAQPPPSGAVRGWADFQLANPTVSLPAGAVSEVTVHAWVRAIYRPDPGTAALPAPIHGEVRARYTVRPVMRAGGQRVLRARPSSDDAQIEFIPAAPLSAADTQTLLKHIRQALRTRFTPMDVELAPDFGFTEFKGLGAGATTAVALPFQLSSGTPPAGAMGGVSTHFLGTSDVAIAVGKEYVQQVVDGMAAHMKAAAASRRYTVLGATYRPVVSAITVSWTSGSFTLSGTAAMVTGARWMPNASVGFTQALTVALHAPSQTVSLVPLGDPQVSASLFFLAGPALDVVRAARDGALPGASAQVNAAFKAALERLVRGLHEFDPTASARYTAIDVTPDGLVVRGDIATSGRLAPVVHPVEIDGGKAYSAFPCWIPGGRIERFEWTWVEGEVWASQIESVSEEHTWVCPRPPGLPAATRVCLRIHGSVTESSGHVDDGVMAGEICRPSWYPPILTVPPWWIEAVVPLWLPRWPELTLDAQVAGHVNVLGETRAPGGLAPNVLVHFTGPRPERSLDALGRVLSETGRRSLLVIVVLPPGSFAAPARELEARLGSPGERFAGHVTLTEDLTGGWARTFAAADGPSTHLIDARGAFVWKADGRLDEAEVTRALAAHALDAPPPLRAPLGLAVEPGQRAPDVHLMDDRGEQFALSRLRGRRVVLAFWRSWSAPSLRELERLQALAGERGAPRIFAINGGEDRGALEEIRRRHGLALPLIPDPGRHVGGRYGVRCWPTTVSINEAGIVDRIQFGLTEGARR